MPGLFVAIDVPEEVRSELAGLSAEVRSRGVKWVAAEQMHVTLRFIGEFREVEAIQRVLARVEARAFRLGIAGVGQFPPKRAARVLWAGVAPVQEISGLAARVDAAVIEAGAAPGDHAYSPHLTLARIRDAQPALVRAFLEKHQRLASPPFVVSEFHLYESLPTPKGAVYNVLETYALGA